MKKKTLFWIIGISVGFLVICMAAMGFGVLAVGVLGVEEGPGFGDAVALIRVEGIIVGGDPPTDLFGSSGSGAFSNSIVRQLKAANEDAAVKAVVLRVDSPGGGVVASDEIYEQVLAMEKPVLVSMGTMAASGGYYISAPATEIWANRHTLTGSIGVIIQFINVEGLFEEYGVSVQTVKSGLNKDTGSLYRSMSEDELTIWQSIIDESYQTFVQIIAEGRALDEATVRDLADGRVYTGKQAHELGLVDNLGNLDDVIERAAELGEIKGTPRIIEYDQPPPLFGGILGAIKRPSPVEQVHEILSINVNPVPMYLYEGR